MITTEPNYQRVTLANSDIYQNNGSSWTFIGNLLGTPPTSAPQQSWGQLKSRYVPSPERTRSATPQDR